MGIAMTKSRRDPIVKLW